MQKKARYRVYLPRLLKYVYYSMRKKELPYLPFVWQIEPTNYCNINCVMCPYDQMSRKKGNMSLEIFKKIIDEIKETTFLINLLFFGEPLMHPQLGKMIEYCKEQGLITFVSTNATLLNKKNMKMILDSELDAIRFSFDGATKESYESVRVGANFEKVTKNIELFLKENNKREKKVYSTIQLITFDKTDKDTEKFLEKWKNTSVSEIVIKKVARFPEQKEFTKTKIQNRTNNFPCSILWESVIIAQDGKVVSCCYDYNGENVLGDLKKQSLKEIWNSEKTKDLREKHIQGKLKGTICEDCSNKTGYSLTSPSKSNILAKILVDLLFVLKIIKNGIFPPKKPIITFE